MQMIIMHVVDKVGIEPTRVIHSQDFKSCASTCSATRPYTIYTSAHDVRTVHLALAILIQGYIANSSTNGA